MALRPRGRATAGPREAHVTLTRGRRPRGRPGGAPRGIRGFADGGSTGIVGPGKKLGAVTQMRYCAPIFKRVASLYSSVWDYVPTRFLCCR